MNRRFGDCQWISMYFLLTVHCILPMLLRTSENLFSLFIMNYFNLVIIFILMAFPQCYFKRKLDLATLRN